jgi:hypothetical protein
MSNDDDKGRLRARAREAEQVWRDERGLTKGLQHVNRKRRRREACPKESKAAVRYRRWREKVLGGKTGAASRVRRIDPVTGEVT